MKCIRLCYQLLQGKRGRKLCIYRNIVSCTVLRHNVTDGEVKVESCLFIPGNLSLTNYATIKPHLDISSQLVDSETILKLKDNMSARNMNKVDLNALLEGWEKLVELRRELQALKDEKEDLKSKIRKMINCEEIEYLEIVKKLKSKVLEKIDHINSKIYHLEQTVVVPALHLPNKLHVNTPIGKDIQVLEKHGEEKMFSCDYDTHMNICRQLNIVKCKKVGPNSLYYLGIAAEMELMLSSYFCHNLQEIGMKQVSCPHICKSVIVEGVRVVDTFDIDKRIIIEDIKKTADMNKHQLVGGSSVESSVGMLSKILVDHTSLPIQNFCCSQSYHSVKNNESVDVEDISLFSTPQSTSVHFICAGRPEHIDSCNTQLLKKLVNCYEDMGLPFIINHPPAGLLSPAESLRTSISIWSPAEKKYIETAWISMYDDYISQRLLMRYIDPKGKNFLHVISGCAMNFPRLFGCIVENNQTEDGKFLIPGVLEPYVISNSKNMFFHK